MFSNEEVPTSKTAQWLRFLTNTEECMNSIKSIGVVVNNLLDRPELDESSMPTIIWMMHMQQILIEALDEKLETVQYCIEKE